MTMKITLELAEMTWAELRRFVSSGEQIDGAERVDFETDEDYQIESLVIELRAATEPEVP